MIERKMLEANITCEDDEEKITGLLQWCHSQATFVHSEEQEFIFWIPPETSMIEIVYGKDIPEEVYNKLNESVNLRAGQEDAGYLLIAFI